MWKNRDWKATRQKYKAMEKAFAEFERSLNNA
jgi:hypothetical protein